MKTTNRPNWIVTLFALLSTSCRAVSRHCGRRRVNSMAGSFLLLLLLSTYNAQLSTVFAQGTAFTYQGRLNDGANPAQGIYDLRFTIYDALANGIAVTGVLTNAATPVTNGLFTVALDFGAGVFTGADRWLEIGVRTNGGSVFTKLTPRQPLTPSPYALYAPSAGVAATAGTAATVSAGAVGTAGLQPGAVDGSKIASGAVDTGNLSPTVLSNTFWRLDGNNGTTPGTQFVGTTDNQPLELRVQGRRAFRLEPATNAMGGFGFSPNVIGGYEGNSIAPGVGGATIAGGGREGYIHQITAPHGTIGGGDRNTVNGEDSTIAGGGANLVNGSYAGIGGGLFNSIGTNAFFAAIAGGGYNAIDTSAYSGAIGGGYYNRIAADSDSVTIAGGNNNATGTNSSYSAIGGGYANYAVGQAATVGGGEYNTASGAASVGGGYYNLASGYECTIGGGYANYAIGQAATVSGGEINIAGDDYATVGGGQFNSASAYFGTIGGGRYNAASGFAATVGGGTNNESSSDYATVGGGGGNTASGETAIVGGGSENTASGWAATVGGGSRNKASSSYTTVGGGLYNNASNLYATVAGGYRNSASGWGASIAGGGYDGISYGSNVASGAASVIGGGIYNSAGGGYATVPGGFYNVAGGDYSFAAGRRAKAIHQGAFVWGDATDADVTSTSSNQFLIRASGGVGIGTNNPRSALHVVGTVTAAGFAGSGAALTGLNASQITVGAVPSGGLAGTYGNALTLSNAANVFAGDGSGLVGLNANSLASGTVPDARLAGNVARTNQVWLLNGNAGTAPGTQFVGTTDNQPLELRVNNARGLRLEPAGSNSVNVIGGWAGNGAAAGVVGATVGGGGAGNYNGNSYTNRVEADFGTVSGGAVNTIQTNAPYTTIGGGYLNVIQPNASYANIGGGYVNTIQTNAPYSTIAGGINNTIQPNARSATIGGGAANWIQTNAENATIGGGSINGIQLNALSANISGGYNNVIQPSAQNATIGGGAGNTIQTNASYATIPGGCANIAGGQYSFAAGYYAQATNAGSFVWADNSTSSRFSSTTNNQFNIRSANGVRIATTSAGTVGVQLAAGATAWTTLSDRNAKKNFRPVDTVAVLEKLAAIPVTQWNYNWEQDSDAPYIGPMAQDFKAAFYPGRDDKGISTLEFDGVELAAIQGLNQKLEAQKAENAELKQQVAELKQMVLQLAQNGRN